MLEYAGFPILQRSVDQLRRFESVAGIYPLTISTSNGGLLSAFLAIFVSLAGVGLVGESKALLSIQSAQRKPFKMAFTTNSS